MSDRIYRNRGKDPKQQVLALAIIVIVSGVIVFCVGSILVMYFGG